MTTRRTPASPVPSPGDKAAQVDRVAKVIEQRQENLARAAAIIRSLSTLRRKPR